MLTFYPKKASFSRENALYLAHASDVAYLRSPAAAAEQRLGLEVVAFRNKLTRTRGFLGVCESHAVLAFRGSDPVTLPAWVTDMVVRLVKRDEYSGRVHMGFSSALKHTWAKVEPILERAQGKPLYLTGHSMGGALAVLTACRLARLGRPAMATYTFGSPRVGDRNFCAGYDLPTYRIVNRLDLVPEMPLASVKRLLPPKPRYTNEKILGKLKHMASRFPCYGHVKTLVYIDGNGAITMDGNVQPWRTQAVADAIATRGKGFMVGIKDHLITSYIRGLGGEENA